jgi:hypothetical protein
MQGGAVLLPQTNSHQSLYIVQSSVDNSASVDKSNHAKRSLFNITGIVDFENNTVRNLALPIFSNNYEQVLKLSSKERAPAYSSMVESSIREKKAQFDPMNRYNSFDLEVIDDTFASKLVNTNYSTSRMESLVSNTTTSHQIEIRTFGPQSQSPELIKAIMEQKKLRQSEKETDVPEDKRSQANTKALLFKIGTTEDVVTTCINFHTIKAAELNLTTMARKSPIVLQLVNHIRDAILINKKYIDKYQHQMEWLPCMLSTSLQNILAAFAEFSTDFSLLLALRAQSSDAVLIATLSSSNYEHLNQTVRVATSVSLAIRQASFAQKALSASEHCPNFWSEASATQGGTPPKLEPADTKDRKRPVSASGEKQNRTSRFQANTRLPQQHQRNRTEEQCGMIYLHDTNIQSASIFPQELRISIGGQQKPLCADFCCQGRKCKRGSCRFAHATRYAQLSQHEFDTMCKHISDKNIGWLSDDVLKRTNSVSLKPEFDHLRGDENGPFGQQNEGYFSFASFHFSIFSSQVTSHSFVLNQHAHCQRWKRLLLRWMRRSTIK